MNMARTARHAVILAAGRGSRLGALTDALPKCLTVVAGRALLDWMLDALFQSGIERVLIVGGYGYESLAAYQSPRVSTICHARWSQTNMLGTLQAADSWLASQPCLIAYSDIAVRHAHLALLRSAPGDIVVANNTHWYSLWSERFADALVDAETFAADVGTLRKIGGRAASLTEIGGQFMGLIKTTPKGWAQLNAELIRDPILAGAGDTTKLLARALEVAVPIKVVDCAGGWIEIDSPLDMQVVERGIANTTTATTASTGNWAHDWRG